MTHMLKKATTMAAAATLAAAFAVHAPAAEIKAGLMLKKDFPGAEPVNGMYELFESEVEKGSGGAITMEIVYGGALGKPNERLNQVRHGIIQMSDASDGNYASIYKDIQILSMPYLFPDEETAWKLLDGPVGTAMAEDIRAKTGIRVLGWWESGGFKHYSANRAIRTPDDMKGLKMRVMAPIFGIPVLTLGGSATPIAFPELYTSLKTGVVDGQDNAVWVFNLIKLHEVQEYLMLDGHIYAFGPLGINDAWFSALSDELQGRRGGGREEGDRLQPPGVAGGGGEEHRDGQGEGGDGDPLHTGDEGGVRGAGPARGHRVAEGERRHAGARRRGHRRGGPALDVARRGESHRPP